MSGASKVSPDCLSASAFNVPIKAVSIQWLSKHYDEIEEQPGMIVIEMCIRDSFTVSIKQIVQKVFHRENQ